MSEVYDKIINNEYSINQYITILWKLNRRNNNYLTGIIDKCDEIISYNNINKIIPEEQFFTSKLYQSDLSMKSQIIDVELSNINEIMLLEMTLLFDKFLKSIKEIKFLQEILNILMRSVSITKLNKYEQDFNEKVNKLYENIHKNKNYSISKDDLQIFMYNNTAEGRLIKQNMGALKILHKLIIIFKMDKVIKNYINIKKPFEQLQIEKDITDPDKPVSLTSLTSLLS